VKSAFIYIGVLLLATATTQQQGKSRPNGVIYGIAIDQDGQPAKGIILGADRLDVGLAGGSSRVKTNNAGEYRFEHLNWGRYIVYAEDEEAGYSRYSTGPADDTQSSAVELTPEHGKAEHKVQLPPKAGFLEIHLTGRRTGGASIFGMRVAVMPMENPESPLFTMGCASGHVVLVPPDKNLLLHVSSDGFREWDESAGSGKPLYLPSGTRLVLDIELDPD
jgi:hypothetical protein